MGETAIEGDEECTEVLVRTRTAGFAVGSAHGKVLAWGLGQGLTLCEMMAIPRARRFSAVRKDSICSEGRNERRRNFETSSNMHSAPKGCSGGLAPTWVRQHLAAQYEKSTGRRRRAARRISEAESGMISKEWALKYLTDDFWR